MSQTAFAAPLNAMSLTLALPYVAASGTVTLASGSAAKISAELARQGLPSISASNPLRFTLASAASIAQFSLTHPTLGPIYLATGLSGEQLTGVAVAEGTTDTNFSAGDSLLVLMTAGQIAAIQAAVNHLEEGADSFPVTDAGGQVYNVEAYGVKADGVQFTGTGLLTSSPTFTTTNYLPTVADVGKTICVQGAGTSSQSLVTTVSAVGGTAFTGTVGASSPALTVAGYTPSAGDIGKVIVVPGANASGTTLYTTVTAVAGQIITLAVAATTAVTSVTVTLAPTITLATNPVTAISSTTVTMGTEDYADLDTLVTTTIKPAAVAGTQYPTMFFPAGRCLVNMAGRTNIPVSGMTISGQGPSSIVQLADTTANTSDYLFVNYGILHVENTAFHCASNSDQFGNVCGILQTGGATGFGNGNTTILRNITATGVMSVMVHAENDDSIEAYGCHIQAGQFLLHSGGNSAGAQLGRVKMIGGSIHDFGLAASNHAHGLYIASGVNVYVAGVRFYNQNGTGFCIKLSDDNQVGVAASNVVDTCVFETTTVNGVIGTPTCKLEVVSSTFQCSAQSVRVQGDTDLIGCKFTGTASTGILDLTVPNAATLRLINCDFLDNQLPINLTTANKWNVILDGCKFTQRTSATFATLASGSTSQVTNCWFSDGPGYGQLPTTSLTNAFAALAGVGSVWWDSTLGVNKWSDGATWHKVLDVDGLAGGQTIIGGTGSGDALNLKGSSNAAGGPLNFQFPTPTGGSWTGIGFSAVGDFSWQKTTNQTTTLANFREAAVVLQDGTANTGADTNLNSNLWTAFQFTYNGVASGSHAVQLQLKRSAVITNLGRVTAQIYSDSAGQPGSALTGSAPVSFYAVPLTTSYATVSLNLGSVNLVNGTSYWIVIQELVAPTGGNLLANSATTNNTNVATGSNGTVWTVVSGPSLYFTILGQHGAALNAQSTTGPGITCTSTTAIAGTFTSTDNFAASFTSTHRGAATLTSTMADAITATSTWGNGISATTSFASAGSFTQSGTLLANMTSPGVSIVRSTALNSFTSTGALVFANDTSGSTALLFDFQASSASKASLTQAGLLTAVTFAGSGASLTSLPSGQLTGQVAIGSGGTGQATKAAGFNALSPNTTLGDVTYFDGSNNVRLAGSTTGSLKFLSQTGTGTISAAPAWHTLAAADIPSLTGTYPILGATNASANESNLVLAQSAAASPSDGEVYYGSSQKILAGYLNGVVHRFAGVTYTQTSAITVSTTGEQSLTSGSTAVGTLTFPANFFVAGKTVRVRAAGYLITSATPGSLSARIKFGATVLGGAGSTALTASILTPGRVWRMEADITCFSAGVSGQFWTTGVETRSTNAGNNTATTYGLISNNSAAVTIDTTASQALDITANFTAASQSLMLTNLVVEVLN